MFDSATPDPQNTVCFNIQQAIDLVAGWTDLSDQRRRDLVCALNTTARLIGLPPGAVLITPQHLRPSLLKQSPVAFGLTGGRMRNIRSCLKTVLRRLRVIDRDDTPLTDDWAALINRMPERKRAGLVGLARYGSAHSFAPSDMNDDLMEAFSSWLENRTLSARPRKHAGETRGAWNRAVNIVAGWPQVKLSFLREVGQFILPLQEFPLSFQKDLDAFGDRLSATPLDSLLDDVEPPAVRDGTASMKKACRPATVRTRKDHVRWAASALAAMGTPVEDITNLTCLVTPPELVKQILRFFYDRAGGQRSAAGGHVADVLRMIAKYHAGLDDGEITKMKRWAKPVTLKYEGMTEKNARHIRQMLDPKAQAQLLVLPSALMASARKLRSQAPQQAASLAMRAAAVAFLTSIPLRLSNLCGLRIDQHLQRGNPPRGRIAYLRIPLDETKNGRTIEVPVSESLSKLLDEWLSDFRPYLAFYDGPYVFPGKCSIAAPITPQGLREAIKGTVQTFTGVPLTPHQFRHLAASLFLRENKGHYEEVRQLLGHADIKTTIRSYCGIETETSVRRYHEILEGLHERPKGVAKRDTRNPPTPSKQKRRA